MKKTLIIVLVLAVLSSCNRKQLNKISGEAQGTTYTIKYIGTANNNLKSKTDSLLLAIDKSLSTYMKESKISALNNGDTIVMDDMFSEVYETSIQIQQKTNGAFNPAFGPLILAWGFDFSDPLKLDSFAVDSIKEDCGFEKFTRYGNRLYKTNKNARLNFNAIAQGYSVDLLASLLDEAHLENYYVELGGELKVKGLNQDGLAWRIGIDKPSGENLQREISFVVSLENKAMATSGNYRKYYELDGKKYSHTINPNSGYPVSHHLLSASVVANTGIIADAYATAFMVLGKEKSIELLESTPEISGILIFDGEKGELDSYVSKELQSKLEEIR